MSTIEDFQLDAIHNAKNLNNQNRRPSEANPGTKVYELVEFVRDFQAENSGS